MCKKHQAISDIFDLKVCEKEGVNSNEILPLKGKGGWEIDNQAAGDTPAARKARQSASLHYTRQP